MNKTLQQEKIAVRAFVRKTEKKIIEAKERIEHLNRLEDLINEIVDKILEEDISVEVYADTENIAYGKHNTEGATEGTCTTKLEKSLLNELVAFLNTLSPLQVKQENEKYVVWLKTE